MTDSTRDKVRRWAGNPTVPVLVVSFLITMALMLLAIWMLSRSSGRVSGPAMVAVLIAVVVVFVGVVKLISGRRRVQADHSPPSS